MLLGTVGLDTKWNLVLYSIFPKKCAATVGVLVVFKRTASSAAGPQEIASPCLSQNFLPSPFRSLGTGGTSSPPPAAVLVPTCALN